MEKSLQILEKIQSDIEGCLKRPVMYVGSTTSDGSSNTLDIFFLQLVNMWSFITEKECEEVIQDVFGNKFAERFRYYHPDQPEYEISFMILDGWRKVVDRLGILDGVEQ